MEKDYLTDEAVEAFRHEAADHAVGAFEQAMRERGVVPFREEMDDLREFVRRRWVRAVPTNPCTYVQRRMGL